MSRLWYKTPGKDQEKAKFHLIVDDYDAMFMTDLVMGHEEIHVFVKHPVDDPILVDEGKDIREDVQTWAVEQNLLGYYDDDGSDDDGSEDANNDEDGFYSFYGSNDMYISDEDHNNDNEDPIELDVEQATLGEKVKHLLLRRLIMMMLLRLMMQRCILEEQVRNM